MSDGISDPLNIGNKLQEDKVEIVYRPHDRYAELAEYMVYKWAKYLKIKGLLKGELGNSDELEMIIAEELRIRDKKEIWNEEIIKN